MSHDGGVAVRGREVDLIPASHSTSMTRSSQPQS
jgi:hypothetical protein